MPVGTVFGPDLSNHNGAVDFAALDALSDVHLVTHKITEGVGWTDPTVAGRAPSLQRFAAPGFYHVLWPTNSQDNPVNQAHWFVDEIIRIAPWMLAHPCPVLQGDFELFSNFTPYRPPTIAECNQFQAEVTAYWRSKGGNPPAQLDYAPYWLYGNTVTGLTGLWWASSYVGGSGDYHALYPGNGDSRWTQIPGHPADVLQYTSSATYPGAASGVDSNGVRGVSTAAQLQQFLLGGDPMSQNGPEHWDQPDIDRWRNILRQTPLTATIGNKTSQTLELFIANTNERVADPSLNPNAVTAGSLAAAKNAILAAIANVPTADEVADAVIAKLPSTVGGVTKQDVLDAVTQVLTGAYLTPKASS